MSDRWFLSIDSLDLKIILFSVRWQGEGLLLRENVCEVVILRGKTGEVRLFGSGSAGEGIAGGMSTQNELLSFGISDNGTVSRSRNERHLRSSGER
jgi:hypothetical protein